MIISPKKYAKKTLIASCLFYRFLFGSLTLETLYENNYEEIQKYLNYQDLKHLTLIKNKFYNIFTSHLIKRLEKDIPTSLENSPLIKYHVKKIIDKSKELVFLKANNNNNIINECLKDMYSKQLYIRNFLNTDLYKQYVNEIRESNESDMIATEQIKKYCSVLNLHPAIYTKTTKASTVIIMFETKNHLVIDIPWTCSEDIIDQLKTYNFEDKNKISLIFNTKVIDCSFLHDLLESINSVFSLKKLHKIDLSCFRLIKTNIMQNINIELFNNDTIIKISNYTMRKLISHLVSPDRDEDKKKIFSVLKHCVDKKESDYREYCCGISYTKRKHYVKRFPFFSNAHYAKHAFDNKVWQRNNNKKIIFSLLSRKNILKNLLENMIYGLGHESQKEYIFNDFLPLFIKHVDPSSFFPYLYDLEIKNDIILQQKKGAGLSLLNWLKDERKKQIKKNGFNFEENIIKYVTQCLKEKNK